MAFSQRSGGTGHIWTALGFNECDFAQVPGRGKNSLGASVPVCWLVGVQTQKVDLRGDRRTGGREGYFWFQQNSFVEIQNRDLL